MNDKLNTSNKVLERRIVKTDDGSSSIEIPAMNEMYHSRKGAIKESQHVYIEHGFNQSKASPIHILEIGMGTALNVILTYLAHKTERRPVVFHTLEPYPLMEKEWQQLNFGEYLDIPNNLIQTIHTATNAETINIDDTFSLEVHHNRLENYVLELDSYDVVYFDAFAPSKQNSPWQMSNIQKMYDALKIGGVLTTYCSQGQFKRNLVEVGFEVTNPEGPMGKREITVAYKN